MKPSIYIIALAVILPFLSCAQDNTLQSYKNAQTEITAMLSGSSPISYERAVYLVENAWWGGNLSYDAYTHLLDAHTTAIKLIAARYHKPADSFTDAGISTPHLVGKTAADRKTMYDKAVLNYAIYSYMRDTTLFLVDSTIYVSLPLQYTHADPMGSTQWANTQVGHLLATGQGNCYAMASLYKILADKLHTGAELCTAPGHIYIRHADENGLMYNIEPGSSNSFPGTGSMATITYSTDAAIENGIALRGLNDMQAVTMCLIYLAKGYEKQYNTDADAFALQCAATALQYDDKNLNAMLLQAEVLERRLLQQEPLAQLQQTATYKEYEALLTKLYTLGYSEMPQDMKNTLVALYNKENIATNCNKTQQTNIVGVSGGLFPETIPYRETEQYSRTLYDTKTKQITGFAPQPALYNHYNFDPVVFAWNMDPMAHKFPGESPYLAFGGNPINNIDVEGDIKFPKDKIKEYRKNFPMIMCYLENNFVKDIEKSNIIINAIVKYTYGGYNSSQLLMHAAYFDMDYTGDDNPEVTFTDGLTFGARGNGYNKHTLLINLDYAKAVENVLRDNKYSQAEKMAAMQSFFETMLDELTLNGKWRSVSHHTFPEEIVDSHDTGDDMKNEVFHTKKNGVPTLDTDGTDPSNFEDFTEGKRVVERKTSEGQTEVLPTLPNDCK